LARNLTIGPPRQKCADCLKSPTALAAAIDTRSRIARLTRFAHRALMDAEEARPMKLSSVVLGLVLVATIAGRSAAADRNKCGCYKDDAGTCYCDKKAKCGCPGECEPKGCEEARSKNFQKEIDAETKKAAAGGHKKSGGEAESAREEKEAPAKASHKMTAAQSKQLAKLLELYINDHPEARSRSIEDVRGDLSSH
jgi:hypothetical protein